MLPTRLQVKQRFQAILDDPSGVVFTDTPPTNSVFQNAFAEGYDILFSAFLNNQVPAVENVLAGIIVAPGTTSLTPAQMGITDFADWEWIAERAAGSSEKFFDLIDEDRLSQRPPTDRLIETVWQDNAFQFIGATTPRELQIKYVASGEAPTADGTVIGIDSSLVFLSNYAVSAAGGRKGYEEVAARCRGLAVGPRFDLGVIGGELFRLVQPLVRQRQNVQIAPRPFSSQRRIGVYRALPYVAAQASTSGNPSLPVQKSTSNGTIVGATDGTNAVFWIDVGVIAITLFTNGVLQTLNVDYTAINNQITFLAGSIPPPGAILTAEVYPLLP